MSKSQRVDEPGSSSLEEERRWHWILTVANGRKFWDWAYDSAFRSQQLTAESESALSAAKPEASECLAKGPASGTSPKRKRGSRPS